MLPAPQLSTDLSEEYISFLEIFSKSCRRSIISMLKNSQSGHPGGSLSSIDYLSLLYTAIIAQTGEKVVVSNGHISPAVYAVLAEMGWIPQKEVIQRFRKVGSPYEGHISRHVPGVWYGTGPLGIGVSVAAGFAFSEKLQGKKEKVYALMGDGEVQEGQVHEMIYFASKYKLDNLILFVDFNRVQLSGSLEEIMPIDIPSLFSAGGWQVLEVDGHNFEDMWKAILEAHKVSEKPVVIVGYTVMGKGVELMEHEGTALRSTWHGKAPKPEEADKILESLRISEQEETLLKNFRSGVPIKSPQPLFIDDLAPVQFNVGSPIAYSEKTLTDCRSAYGAALLDLAKLNESILALTADLRGSVKTDMLAEVFPERHIEVGIAEQNMISIAGGLSLVGFVPFASTFGAFMSSRAKDQARVNDINRTNVKMVATHCGLSVGEDGPTHQAIDDMGSFLGMFHTHVIEPADPNHCDRIIRYIASHYGNFYVRMGRQKVPVLTKENGEVFYDAKYEYIYGKCDLLRLGMNITIAASGPMVAEVLHARDQLQQGGVSVELIVMSSPKEFDDTIAESVKKTKNLLVIEDHNCLSGFGGQVARYLFQKNVHPKKFATMGVSEYQLSGTSEKLYESAKISAEFIVGKCMDMLG
ncbi:transketolase [Candidatus Peregrinibacteria bacterium]|nr:transketolase [Candidatus Peregrinibacteria bacterium]